MLRKILTFALLLSSPAIAQNLNVSPSGAAATTNVAYLIETPALLASSTIPAAIDSVDVEYMTGSHVAPGAGTCGLEFHKGTATPTGVYGEILNAPSGIYWEPVYSVNPVKVCEFAAKPDATMFFTGSNFVGTANGTNTVTISSGGAGSIGMNVAIVNYASLGATNVPAGTTITGVGAGTVTLSNPIAAGTNLNFVSYWILTDAKVGGTDNRPMIQAALDYALSTHTQNVLLPDGFYRVTSTLHLGYGNTFSSVQLLGTSTTGAFAQGLGGAAIICTAQDRPCINIAGGRNSGLQGITLLGPNANYSSWGQVFNNNLSPSEFDWIAPELARTGVNPGGLQQKSPLAAITIDAWAGSTAMTAPYAGPFNFPAGVTISPYTDTVAASSDTKFRRLQIQGFGVGVATHLNTNSQGDFDGFQEIKFSGNVYDIAISGSQSRNVAMRDLTVAGEHTFLTGTRFGMGQGEINGPIDNLSGGACYQLFDFTSLSITGPLVIRSAYTENCVRIGRLIGGNWSSAVIFQGGLLSMLNTAHGRVPAAFIESGGATHFLFDGLTLQGGKGVTALISGGESSYVDAEIRGGQFTGCYDGVSTVALQIACNYTGGIFIGSPIVNSVSHRNLIVDTPYRTSYFPTSTSAFGQMTTHGGKHRFVVNVAREYLFDTDDGFVDKNGRTWKFQLPNPAQIVMTSLSQVTVPPAFSACDTMTYTLKAGIGGGMFAPQPGRIEVHGPTGTIFVVTATAPSGADTQVTTQQLNNKTVNPSTGVCITNTLSDLTLAGTTYVYPSGVVIPSKVFRGTFTSGSGSITNVTQGDGTTGSDLATYWQTGDFLGYQAYPDGNWPINYLPSNITVVTAGNPGSMTMSAGSGLTGTFPIYPVPIY